VRVFSFASGKLRRSYDESPEAAAELQRHGGEALKLEPIDFGRRLAVERELVADEEVRHVVLVMRCASQKVLCSCSTVACKLRHQLLV
jgi:hypothetical protein